MSPVVVRGVDYVVKQADGKPYVELSPVFDDFCKLLAMGIVVETGALLDLAYELNFNDRTAAHEAHVFRFRLTDLPERVGEESIRFSCRLAQLPTRPAWLIYVSQYVPPTPAAAIQWKGWQSVLDHPEPFTGLMPFVLVDGHLISGHPCTLPLLDGVVCELDVHMLSTFADMAGTVSYARQGYVLSFCSKVRFDGLFYSEFYRILRWAGLTGEPC